MFYKQKSIVQQLSLQIKSIKQFSTINFPSTSFRASSYNFFTSSFSFGCSHYYRDYIFPYFPRLPPPLSQPPPYRQLRARRALSLFHNFRLRTTALSLQTLYSDSALLILNRTLLNSDNIITPFCLSTDNILPNNIFLGLVSAHP